MKHLVISSERNKLTLVWRRMFRWCLVVTCWSITGVAVAVETNVTDILAGLRPEHPRLLLTSGDLQALRAISLTNPETATIITRAEAAARLALSEPLLTRQMKGKRLLAVSREALRRTQLWGFAWRLTNDKVFLERAQAEMFNVAAFKDWNPSHFLDTAEMTAALAIGYDWLFAGLSADARATVRKALVEKGIQPALNSRADWNWWQTRDNNWNQVCFGGLTLGVLALAEDEPVLTREWLSRARTNNLIGLKPYEPDGIYPEGPGYWGYGTKYQVLMISALESALSTDWNLSAHSGFLPSAAALVQQIGPFGHAFNFADARGSEFFHTPLFWFAQRLLQPELVYQLHQVWQQRLADPNVSLPDEDMLPLLAKWTATLPREIPPPKFPLAWHGDGPNPVGVFRSSWVDTNALFLAFKGGSARVNHSHLDAGSFVLDVEGVRWAVDLGAQDYLSIESKGWNLFSLKQASDRWRVYRLNNFSHNTLTLGGRLHHAVGDARITAFTTNSATVNLSEVFTGQADCVTRRFEVGENRKVVIRDEITGGKPDLSVRWQMMTGAEVKVEGSRAELRQAGRLLRARIIQPAGAKFEQASAQPPADGVNQPNPNMCLLVVDTAVPTSGKLSIEVELQPGR